VGDAIVTGAFGFGGTVAGALFALVGAGLAPLGRRDVGRLRQAVGRLEAVGREG
jgi:hypothetical protein